MIRYQRVLAVFSITILVSSFLIIPLGHSCKDIVATTQATAGEYNLLLKVRDPSRPGLQVLCRIPKGTTYTYQHPWTGKPWDFTVTHTFIGVATKGDTLPNIVKAGMAFTDAGLAFGDADTGSSWKNPTRYAWDDFDWMRYASQTADNEEQAIDLLTKDAIDSLHATGVSENLFIVGPQDAVVIEADAVHHTTKPVDGILVMSNYPKDLWRTQLFKSLPVASSFDTKKELWARQGSIIRLRSLCGVKIMGIEDQSITVKAVPSFVFRLYGQDKEVTINLGERGTAGPYSVQLLGIDNKKAQVSVRTAVNAWEHELLKHIQPRYGHITVETMMNLSRLHTSDLDGLRPLCEDAYPYEAAMIFKIPKDNANLLSSGWFSANHACSSIYVPVHICDNDMYDPYQTGEAAELSLELLNQYGHGTLSALCHNVEKVFLFENQASENLAHDMIHNASDVSSFLTTIDRGMQEQAFLTEQLWLHVKNPSSQDFSEVFTAIGCIWKENYTTSLTMMENAVTNLGSYLGSFTTINTIEKIALSICKTRLDAECVLGRNDTTSWKDYQAAVHCFETGDYHSGFLSIHKSFHNEMNRINNV